MFVRRAFAHHRYRNGFVVVVIVLVCADINVIARLELPDVRLVPRNIEVFRRTRDGDCGNRLVVVFDDDSLFADVAQCSDERLPVGLAPLLRAARTALRIALATARISSAGITANAGYADHDLAETGKAGQKDKYH